MAGYAYKSFATRLLFVDGPQYNDIRQGSVGDCYFLASLASLAQSDPGIIQQMIAPLGDGTYAVRFYRSGSPVYLRLDADLPASSTTPNYAKLTPTGELWVALTEKAYAQFRYGSNSYSSLSGGWMTPVYQEVTNTYANEYYTSDSAQSLLQTMSTNLAAGHAITAASWSSATGPVVGSHAYMIKSVDVTGGFVTVYNPWGYDGRTWDSNSSDGLLTLSIAQFQTSYSTVVVCMA